MSSGCEEALAMLETATYKTAAFKELPKNA